MANPCHDRSQCNASIPFETYTSREDTMKELFTVYIESDKRGIVFPYLTF